MSLAAAMGADANRGGDRDRWRDADAAKRRGRGTAGRACGVGAGSAGAQRGRPRGDRGAARAAARPCTAPPLASAPCATGSIGDGDRERFQWNLLRSHAVSAGRPLNVELVRAGMVVRANQLGAGGAGVTPTLLDALIAALNDGVVPLTRELGSLGTGRLPGSRRSRWRCSAKGRCGADGELVDAQVPNGADPARPARRARLHELERDDRRSCRAPRRRRAGAA